MLYGGQESYLSIKHS